MENETEYFGADMAFRSKPGILIVTAGLDGFEKTTPRASEAPVINPNVDTVWAKWGDSNQEPKEIAGDIENLGVLDAALEAKGKIATGKGVLPHLFFGLDAKGEEQTECILDTEILDFLEANNYFDHTIDSIYDKWAYGWNCGSFVLSLNQKKIERIKRHDVYEARLEKKEALSRLVKNLYLSADWQNSGVSYDPHKQVRIELLEEGNEINDLFERIAGNSNKVEFAFANRTIRNGRHYYPQPTYRSNKAWLKIARSVPAFKIAMFKNQITLNYLVTVHPKFFEDKVGYEWAKYTAAQRKKVQDDYYDKITEWLVGEDKAYKSLFAGGFTDEFSGKFTPYVTVEVVDNKLKDGQLLPDSGAAISEILFALMIQPALMGAGNPGGNAYGDTSGGSNIRESFLVQLMLAEADRRANAGPLNVVKKYNEWDKRLEIEKTFIPMVGAGQPTPQSKIIKPRLVWRYQSGLLTTLDTGKSTKAENL